MESGVYANVCAFGCTVCEYIYVCVCVCVFINPFKWWKGLCGVVR